MLRVELKRMLKTRSTWGLFVIAFTLSLFFAFYTVRHEAYYQYENGQTEIIRGSKAYELKQDRYDMVSGKITPELMADAMKIYHEIIEKYGDDYSVPAEISDKVLGPYSPVYTWIMQAFTDKNGIHYSIAELSPEQMKNFNEERIMTLQRLLEEKYNKVPQVKEYAMTHVDMDRETFDYNYGIGSTHTFDNLGILTFIITLICIVIAAPVFSADYASGADDILRCTRDGKRRLAITKLCSAFIIGLGVFIICIGTFLTVIYVVFGFNDKTSAELLNVMYNPDSLTAIGILGMIIISIFLSFMAMYSFTLFLSSQFKNSILVLALSIAIAILPTIIRMFGAGGSFGIDGVGSAEGNMINWIRFCLPSGGLTMVGSMLDELVSLHFLWLGDWVIWSSYILLIAATIQIPIWLGLSVHFYRKHEAN